MNLALSLILALVWGGIWAAILQWTPGGRYLAACRAWLAVVIGLGVDLLILLAVLPLADWLRAVAVIAASSIGIVGRSLWNEYHGHRAVMDTLSEESAYTRWRHGDPDPAGK